MVLEEKMKINTIAIFLLLSLLMFSIALAEPITLVVIEGKPNLVKFTSKAPLETIVGTTSKINGSLTFDPDNLNDVCSAELTVDMASLDTDNRIRNGHMRNNHLHTDKYPNSVFVMKGIGQSENIALLDGKEITFKINGDFTLHGVTRAIEPEITALLNAGNKTLEITARFDVHLQDYEIPRPQFLIMKLDEIQKIEINFTAHATE
jgi:polyisoprenoid-binding protein YceI